MSITNAVPTPLSIPLGFMMSASEYGMAGSRIKGMVLEQVVKFDPLSYVDARASMFDIRVVNMLGEPVLMFVLQIEDARLSWLANPAEPAVWKAIDGWRANGSVSVALSNNSTHLFVIPYRHRMDESIVALRRSNQLVADLVTIDAVALLGAGVLDNYEIPGVPAPAHSAACLLHTDRAEIVLQRLGYRSEWDAEACAFHARRIADDTAFVGAASASMH